jgi:predicted ATPase
MWLCAGLTRAEPLVLIVDDAQWSDRPSLQVLSYLAGRTCDLPLLILVAARVGDPRGANDLLALLAGARSATVLHPQPLTSMGAVRLIRGLVPEASIHVCCDCHRATAGNPWLLDELARQMRTHGPAAIERPDRFAPLVTSAARAVVRRRLAELEPRDRAVAAARAVIGDGAPPHAIAQVATIELTELGRAHDALTAAGFLRADGNDIAHELIASAIRDELTSAERERLHRESARALIELGPPVRSSRAICSSAGHRAMRTSATGSRGPAPTPSGGARPAPRRSTSSVRSRSALRWRTVLAFQPTWRQPRSTPGGPTRARGCETRSARPATEPAGWTCLRASPRMT